MKSKIVTFAKNYKAPLSATVVFIVIVGLLLFSRTIEYLALSEVLGKNSSEQSYGALLSKDSSYELKKNDLGQPETTDQQDTQQTNKTPFTVSATPTQDFNNTGNTNPSGDTGSGTGSDTGSDPSGDTGSGTGGDTGSDPGGDPGTPPPFSAIVSKIRLDSKMVDCPPLTGQPTAESCIAKYTFVAEIDVENGPGEIQSFWHGGPPQFFEPQIFFVADDTFVYKDIILPCSNPIQFNIQYVIQQPNASQSIWLTQPHFCEIP